MPAKIRPMVKKNNDHGNNKAINIRILFYSKSRFKNSWRETTFMAPRATGPQL
jgi:hypothetical protein